MELQAGVPGVANAFRPLGGLAITCVARGLITLLATNLPIPAGIFFPVFLIGAIQGRYPPIYPSLGPYLSLSRPLSMACPRGDPR